MTRNGRIIAFVLIALVLAGGTLWLMRDLIDRASSVPPDRASVVALAQNLASAKTRQGSIREPDLDLLRLMPGADGRVVQITMALESLLALHDDREELVEAAFEALTQGDTGPGEAILQEIYQLAIDQADTDQQDTDQASSDQAGSDQPDHAAIAKAGRDLAALTALHDTDAALNIYSETASLAADLPLAWAHLGHISQREGRHDLAVRAYDMSLFLAGDGENERAEMAARAGLAVIALHAGDLIDTEANSRMAMAIAEKLGDKEHLAVTYSISGRIQLLQGNYEQAEVLQLGAFALEEELGRGSGLARVNDDLGLLARLRGDHAGALSFHRAALAHSEDLGLIVGIARQAAELGSDFKSIGDVEAACVHWKRALPLFEETGNPTRVEQMVALIGANDC
jgi:tetratricopeptide (TPR) repeat protein